MKIELDERKRYLTVEGLTGTASLPMDQMLYFCGFRGVTETSRRYAVIMQDYSEVFFTVQSSDAEKVDKALADFAENVSYAEYLKISRL